MKRLLLLCALAIPCFMACEKMDEAVSPDVEQQQDPVQSYVMRVAEEGIAMLGDAETRAVRRRIDPNRIKPCITTATRSGESDTLYYVVNFADSAGFALVAADSTSPAPLLAVTEQGNYTPGEVTNSGFDDYIASLDPGIVRPTPPEGPQKRRYNQMITGPEIVYEPLLEVRWGQGSPYNGMCYVADSYTRSVTGCMATALAQIMSFHEYPDTLAITHPQAYAHDMILEWGRIKYHAQNDASAGALGCYCADHTQLQNLMRQLGQLMDMKYYPLDSEENTNPYAEASPENVLVALDSLGYSHSALHSYTWSSVFSQLRDGLPVYCRADSYTNNAGNTIGHAWVIDGAQFQSKLWQTWEESDTDIDTLIDEVDLSIRYLHINWGYDGNNNGMFQEGVFITDQYEELDDGCADVRSEYLNSNVQIITNIIPSTNQE